MFVEVKSKVRGKGDKIGEESQSLTSDDCKSYLRKIKIVKPGKLPSYCPKFSTLFLVYY